MSLTPVSYEAALKKVRSRPVKPRTPLKPGKPLRRIAIAKGGKGAGNGFGRSVRKPSERGKPKKAKLQKLPALKRKVWKQFSIFIRTRNADENGYVQCVTCPAVHLWNSGDIHAGHWIHNKLDYDPRNVSPQCKLCNYHWNTKVNIAYAVFMAKTYGVEVMDELKLLSHTKGNKYSRAELEELYSHYSELNKNNPLTK